MKLSAKEIARRKRIAGLDSLSSAEQAQRVGICLGAWLWWLCKNELTGRPFIHYPKPDVAEIARRLKIATMPLSRGEQAKLVGLGYDWWMRWLNLRRTEGEFVPEWEHPRMARNRQEREKQQAIIQEKHRVRLAEIRHRLKVMDNGKSKIEQAREIGLTVGGWSFWKTWARGRIMHPGPGRRVGVPAIVIEATEKGGHDEQRERS